MNRDAELARSILKIRRFPVQEFSESLFGDVAWDMLLILFIANAEGRRRTGRELIRACSMSFGVGTRWMAHLNKIGLVVGDGEGHVDDVLTISAVGLGKMERLLSCARETYAAAL